MELEGLDLDVLDVLVSVANLVYLFSYLVRDILWLRILTVIGASLFVPYYYQQVDPLWTPMVWIILFIVINIVWITRLLIERRPVKFNKDEERLYNLALRNIHRRDAHKLFKMATWSTFPAQTILLTQDEPVDRFSLIVDGEVSVEIDGTPVDTLGEGRFLGAIAFLNRDKPFTTPVTVRTTQTTRVIDWPFAEFEHRFAKDYDIQIAVEASLGLEISRYLKAARAQLMSSIVR